MDIEQVDFFSNREKAIQHAIWLNFKYRIANKKFGVIEGTEGGFKVIESIIIKDLKLPHVKIPENHSKLSFDEIRHIRMDHNPLNHWEELCGTFSTMDGELLRFILHTEVPLEKLIRHELASRGYDKNHHWCGFEKAEKIWLENE